MRKDGRDVRLVSAGPRSRRGRGRSAGEVAALPALSVAAFWCVCASLDPRTSARGQGALRQRHGTGAAFR